LLILSARIFDSSVEGRTILSLYEEMMRRFFSDRASIPAGHLVELRLEELERDPLGELRRVYDTLNPPGYADAEPAFQAHIASQRTYRKNRLDLSADDRRSVDERWGFAFAELGYTQQAES
jgi:omega-hydroxy-beta-dihydromenaquinone-9 sulfotransferase